jgi:hypothetical protein
MPIGLLTGFAFNFYVGAAIVAESVVSKHIKDAKSRKEANAVFSNTAEGQEVLRNYKRAAELGSEDAKKRLKQLRSSYGIQ